MSKITIHFYLYDTKSELTSIIMTCSFSGSRVKIATGCSVSPKQWNKSKEQVKPQAGYSMSINSALSDLQSEAIRIYNEAISLKVKPTAGYMKRKICLFINPEKEKSQEHKFMDCYDLFVKERENNGQFKYRTIQTYSTVKTLLEDFSKATKFQVTFDNMNREFYERFINYLTSKDKNPLTNVSADTKIKILKTFLNYCLEKGFTKDTAFIKAFTGGRQEQDKVALTEDEVTKLETMEIPSKHLDNIRKLFLIEIYTGVRYSDLEMLRPENIDMKHGLIRLTMFKTEDPVILPIHKRLMKILKDIPELKLEVMSNQKYNAGIHKLCEFAGFDTPVLITKYYGRKRVDETIPKHKLITSHTARRTFVTLLLKRGMLPELVMKLSGHKDRASFQKYVRVTQNEAIEAGHKAWE